MTRSGGLLSFAGTRANGEVALKPAVDKRHRVPAAGRRMDTWKHREAALWSAL